MPIYKYVAEAESASCAHCRAGFEVQQYMADPPLERCPNCGKPVRRAIFAVGISTNRPSRNLLSDKNLREKRFKKLVNEGDGRFRNVL